MTIRTNEYAKENRLRDIQWIYNRVNCGVLGTEYIALASMWEKMLYNENTFTKACQLIDEALEDIKVHQKKVRR